MDAAPIPLEKTCLLLADRHQALLEGIQGLLRSRFDAVVTVSDEASLREAVRRMSPTLVVLDLGLAADGLGVLRRLRNLSAEQKVVLLSLHDAAAAAEAAWQAGADAFVVKASIAEDLVAAANAVLDGRRFCSATTEREAASRRETGDSR